MKVMVIAEVGVFEAPALEAGTCSWVRLKRMDVFEVGDNERVARVGEYCLAKFIPGSYDGRGVCVCPLSFLA